MYRFVYSGRAVMNAQYQELAKSLTNDLGLTSPPVQVSYTEQPPSGVRVHAGPVPSVCTFFSEGRKEAFYADLHAHENCEIGAFVLGVAPEGEVGSRLMATVGMMQKEGYLQPGDEGKIPRNAKPPRYVAYGPLGSLPMAPTTVLMFANAKSAMLAMEAAGGPVPMNGRPMCAVVPTLNQGAPVAASMGCIGSRIYTGLADGEMIVGVRGDHLQSFAAAVRKIKHANEVVAEEDSRRMRAVRSKHP
jgi:uncharacterized protein (DUF169 family)